MKKLIMTIAIVLGMCFMSVAQDISEETYEEKGLFGLGEATLFDRGVNDPLMFPNHGEETDVDSDQVPLGNGIVLLTALGTTYLVGKKHKKD